MTLDEIKAGLTALEKGAAELLKSEGHLQSPHAAALRSRLVAACESLENHEKWLAEAAAKAVGAAGSATAPEQAASAK